MKPAIVAAVLFFSVNVSAGEPIANPGLLDNKIVSCFLAKAKEVNCAERILSPRILPGNDQLIPIAKQIDELVNRWLSRDRIFAVHPIRTAKAGDVFRKTTFLLEDSSGNLMVFNYATLKRLGKWYVFSFNVNSNSEAIKAVFESAQ